VGTRLETRRGFEVLLAGVSHRGREAELVGHNGGGDFVLHGSAGPEGGHPQLEATGVEISMCPHRVRSMRDSDFGGQMKTDADVVGVPARRRGIRPLRIGSRDGDRWRSASRAGKASEGATANSHGVIIVRTRVYFPIPYRFLTLY
jgi:hypothetical protein